MSKKIYLAVLIAAISQQVSAHTCAADTTKQQNNKMGLYTFFINVVPDGFKFPLFGFVNQAQGSHTSMAAGFINTTQKNSTGLQAGFINTAGGAVTGMQAGFVNVTGDSLSGMQSGFMNTVKRNCTGGQFGFMNTTKKYVYGMQAGFINTAGDSLTGVQAGFINAATQKVDGAQLGFINTTRDLRGTQAGFINTGDNVTGAQIGFINTGKKVKGFQLGFINIADTVEAGMPFGFLSFVKKGGFSAVDLGVSEMYPVNMSLRVGVKKFYTVILTSFNPQHEKAFAVGGGFGAIFPAGNKFYVNPEMLSQNTIADFSQQTVSIATYMGFTITKKFHVLAGPSVVWNNVEENNEFYKPMYSFYTEQLDKRNRLMVGARISLRYAFNW